jgi:hypothetical protein
VHLHFTWLDLCIVSSNGLIEASEVTNICAYVSSTYETRYSAHHCPQAYTEWKGKNVEVKGYEKWENPLSAACD